MYEQLFASLGDGATLVTVNRRLAKHFHAEYARAQIANGRQSWRTPDILPWSAWCRRRFEEVSLFPDMPALRVLDPLSETLLWESVIEQATRDNPLLQVQAAAQEAAAAWRLCREWCLDPERAGGHTEDSSAFLDWLGEYRRRCQAGGWIDGSSLVDWLQRHLSPETAKTLPRMFILAGFDEVVPQQQLFLDALENLGCVVDGLVAPERAMRTGRLEFSDSTQEIQAAALWSRRELERHPGLRLGVVVPDLAGIRDRVERIFDRVLHPGREARAPSTRARAFNLSVGRPLAACPVIHSALLLLKLVRGEIDINVFGSLLRSPYVGGAEEELDARSLFDVTLRRSREPAIGLKQLLMLARRAEPGCFGLVAVLEALERRRDGLRQPRPLSLWVRDLSGWLNDAGWPGQRGLDSAEHQAVKAWRSTLGGLAALESVVGEVGLESALGIVQRTAADTLFQPESAEDTPIQILGLLEAAGGDFDRLWVMGLHDEAWPPPAQPNALLPLALQRGRGLPHATPERELDYARRLTKRLAGAAAEVIFSCPLRDGDRDLGPSPLILRFPRIEAESLGLTGAAEGWDSKIRAAAALEEVPEGPGPAVARGEQVGGGTALLTAQAACPFRAFARFRLGAEALEVPSKGLDMRVRGKLVHRALEHLWRHMRDHATLASLSGDELAERVDRAVEAAISEERSRYPHTFGNKRFTAIERWRLARLLRQWLEVEKSRPGFSVEGEETRVDVDLAGLRLETVADRIDRLPDGSLAIIDYKTGRPDPRKWFDERPEEPQLPLYTVFSGGPVSAVLYAQVRPGETRFAGVTRLPDMIPGVGDLAAGKFDSAEDWEGMIRDWRRVLYGLALEIEEGKAEVAPRDAERTCQYCDLPTLCRINEMDLGEVDGGEEGTDGD